MTSSVKIPTESVKSTPLHDELKINIEEVGDSNWEMSSQSNIG